MLAAAASSASAQTSDEGTNARADESDDVIIVTARRRDERLQDSPVVISALSPQTLDDFAIDSIEDISDFTPGLVADSQGNPAGGILFLRGVGSGSASPSIDQAVSLVIDDMQVGSLNIQNTAFVDMASVQVYKGPQALFFGKNSPGGVVAIRTADPGDTFEGQVRAGYDFYTREYFGQAVVSAPVTDTLGARLVARYSDSDGFFRVDTGTFPDVYNGRAVGIENIFARGTLLWEPSADWTVRAKLTYNDISGTIDGRAQIQRILCVNDTPINSAPFPCEADRDVQITPIAQGALDVFASQGVNFGPAGINENEQWLGTVSIEYDANDTFSVTSVTGFYKLSTLSAASTSFSLAQALAIASQDLEFDQFTQELRLASNFDGPFNFSTGAFYESKTHESRTVVPVNALLFDGPNFFVLGGITEYTQDTEAMSGFFEGILDVSDQLEISAGVRYSYEQKVFVGISNYIGTEKATFDDWSPQVTVSYKPTDDWLLFGSYRQGFKSGSFDGAFQFAPIPVVRFEPEQVEGFEVGAKGSLGDLQVSLAAFMYDYEELQLSSFDAETITLKTVNAAAAEVNGAELDFVWQPAAVDGLQVRGALAYLDATFNEYAAPCYTGQSIADGCDGNFDGAAFTTQDLSGAPLSLAAEFVGTLGVAYEQDMGGVVLGLSADGTYSSGYETGGERTPGTRQDSYAMFNASVSVSSPDDAWSLALIGRNLTNEYTLTNGGTSPFTGGGEGTPFATRGDSIAYVRPGRTIAVEATINF